MKVGWKDPTTSKWYDVEGIREGPPVNYWRQSSDETDYVRDRNIAHDMIEGKNKGRGDKVIRNPHLNRKILGTWCPLSTASFSKLPPLGNTVPTLPERFAVEVDYILMIERLNGRILGKKNHYGHFDAHLTETEELKLTMFSPSTFECRVGVVGGVFEEGGEWGEVEYVSDYVMVCGGGVWMRVEEEEFKRLGVEEEREERVMMEA
ncbi:hypothetical protein TrVE_jg13404 [Triparma verrucosa]|uniref:Uncharacterized protein n=1 Tax=Triparma verrucosa TaxID=1606542 RepID=A0A9W7FJW9_9STRA|nr:hypothetical protein TrVE_jg13404 [Triparma verrucosa]